jgi:hypothetical protein
MSTILEHTRTTLPPTATPEEAASVAAALAQALAPKDIEFRGVTATASVFRCPVCETDEAVDLPIPTYRLHRLMEKFHARHARCIVGRAVAGGEGESR